MASMLALSLAARARKTPGVCTGASTGVSTGHACSRWRDRPVATLAGTLARRPGRERRIAN